MNILGNILDFLVGDKLEKALSIEIELKLNRKTAFQLKQNYDETKSLFNHNLSEIENQIELCKSEFQVSSLRSIKSRIEAKKNNLEREFAKSIVELTTRNSRLMKNLDSLTSDPEIQKAISEKEEKNKYGEAYETILAAYQQNKLDKETFKNKRKEVESKLGSKVTYSDMIVQDPLGRILLLKRAVGNDAFAEKWGLPGGHVDPHEEHKAAAIRECDEESGICTDQSVSKVAELDNSKAHIEYYRTYSPTFPIVIINTREHSDYEWVLPEDLENYDLIGDLFDTLRKVYPQQDNEVITINKAFITVVEGYCNNQLNQEALLKYTASYFEKSGKKGSEKVAFVMKEFKEGRLKDSNGNIVTDRKQAMAIALSEAGLSKGEEEIDNDEEDSEVKKSIDTIIKALETGKLQFDLIKAQVHKYIRREGTTGNWKYIYEEPKQEDKVEDKPISKEERKKNFKEWFGDSKVVDDKGKPLVVYHGTKSNFNEFKQSESIGTHNENDQLEGIYFTDNKDGANWYALVEDDPRFLKETYLSIKKPFIVENHKELREKLNISELKGVKGKLEDLGFDGLIIKKGFYSNGLHTLYLAFNPTQIKSATDNVGTFDPNSNDINKAFLGIGKKKSGIYEDNAENRSLHRVGQKYSKEGKEEEPKENKSPKGEEEKSKPSSQEKSIEEHAKQASGSSLEIAAKEATDPEVRAAAHKELDRRSKEEAIQTEGDKKEGETKSESKEKEKKNLLGVKDKIEDLSDKYRDLVKQSLDDNFSDPKKTENLADQQKEISRYIQKIKQFENTDIKEETKKVNELLGLKSVEDIQKYFGDGKVIAMKVDGENVRLVCEDAYIDRSFVDGDTVEMHEFILNPELDKSMGKGSDIFNNQVKNFKDSGFTELSTGAARGPGYNGYYTWARLGYDFATSNYKTKFDSLIKESKDKDIQSVESLPELMSFQKGRDFWKENGFEFLGTFDLAEDSKSNFILNKYMEEKKNARK